MNQSSTVEQVKSDIQKLIAEAKEKALPYSPYLANELENILIKLWSKNLTSY